MGKHLVMLSKKCLFALPLRAPVPYFPSFWRRNLLTSLSEEPSFYIMSLKVSPNL